MKHKSKTKEKKFIVPTEEILKNIRLHICDAMQFSFKIDEKLGMEICYGGTGIAKAMLYSDMLGAWEFVEDIKQHSNCIGSDISPVFYDKIKQAATVEKTDLPYWKTGEKIIFDRGRLVVMDPGNIDLNKKADGVLFSSHVTGDIPLILHKIINGGRVSLLYNGHVVSAGTLKGKDPVKEVVTYLAGRIDVDELGEHLQRLIDTANLKQLTGVDIYEEIEREAAGRLSELGNTESDRISAKIDAKIEADEKAAADGKRAKLAAEMELLKAEQAAERKEKRVRFGGDFISKYLADEKVYRLTGAHIWFCPYAFTVCEANATAEKGFLIEAAGLEGVQIVKHATIDGQNVSLLYRGELFAIENTADAFDQIEAAVVEISRRGIAAIYAEADKALADLAALDAAEEEEEIKALAMVKNEQAN